MPTWFPTPQFRRDWKTLTREEQVQFRRVVVEQFVPDLRNGANFRPTLRVKRVKAAPGAVWEMTWKRKNGRATFEYGPEETPGEAHVFWRRIGGHEIFKNP